MYVCMCKCELFKKEDLFLGRIILADGYQVGPKATDAVTKLKGVIPKIVEVHKIMCLLGVYRLLFRISPKSRNRYTIC